MADIITNEQHPNVSFTQQLLAISGKSSLLAAPTKCNSPRPFDYAAAEKSGRNSKSERSSRSEEIREDEKLKKRAKVEEP
jgi:hypothetical protein